MLDKAVTNGSEVFALPLGNVHKGCSGWVLSQRHPRPNFVEEPTPQGGIHICLSATAGSGQVCLALERVLWTDAAAGICLPAALHLTVLGGPS